MTRYIEILKKCKTLHGSAQVYVAVMLDEKLTNKEKDQFGDLYIEYTKNLTK